MRWSVCWASLVSLEGGGGLIMVVLYDGRSVRFQHCAAHLSQPDRDRLSVTTVGCRTLNRSSRFPTSVRPPSGDVEAGYQSEISWHPFYQLPSAKEHAMHEPPLGPA